MEQTGGGIHDNNRRHDNSKESGLENKARLRVRHGSMLLRYTYLRQLADKGDTFG